MSENDADPQKGMRDAIEDLMRLHSRESLGSNIDYNDKNLRKAYIYLYLAIHSAAVERSFADFSDSPGYRDWFTKLDMKKISLCTVGGGPGSDMLGLVKALHSQSPELTEYNCNNVDKCVGWGKEFQNIMIRQMKKMVNPTPTVNLHFDDIDLTKKPTEAFLNLVEDADIVTLVKFLSSFPKSRPEVVAMLQAIISRMKTNAILFYLDGAGDRAKFNMLSKTASERGLKLIYGPKKTRFYSIQHTNDSLPSLKSPLDTLRLQLAIWVKPAKLPFDPKEVYVDNDDLKLSTQLENFFMDDDSDFDFNLASLDLNEEDLIYNWEYFQESADKIPFDPREVYENEEEEPQGAYFIDPNSLKLKGDTESDVEIEGLNYGFDDWSDDEDFEMDKECFIHDDELYALAIQASEYSQSD